ncbi:acyltransferase family protein [Bradyrhizobium sp. RDM12]
MTDSDVHIQKSVVQSPVSGASGGSIKKNVEPSASSFLDFCRGLAASVVVISHAEEIFDIHVFRLSGALGVSIFFLLSGFLITISIRNHLNSRQARLSVFLSDRFARIATPYLPILVVVALLNVWLVSGNWGQYGINRGLYALLGNALFLNDYPIFQALSNRWFVADFYIRSYNTAEPFWTIPIEFWIYVGAGLFAFSLLGREKLRAPFVLIALTLCLPVIVWNSFAGGGKCLTLIWMVGALFALLWLSLEKYCGGAAKVGLVLASFGSVALVGKVAKVPFDPHDLQTAVFIACILFGTTFFAF